MKREKCESEKRFDMCPFVTAQNLIQGKWTILILQELSTGKKRFSELLKKIEITQTTLSSQLKTLEKEGLISREIYPEVPPRVEYSLTEIGDEFKPVLNSIEEWGDKYIKYLEEKNK